MKKLLQILTVLIIVVGIIMLAFSYVATIVYADDGYPAPIDNGYPVGYPVPEDNGYPLFWFPNWEHQQNFGYPAPVDQGYPVPVEPAPIKIVVDPFEPVQSIDLMPVRPEIQSKYIDGRNLWQEIVFRFSALLDLIK